MADSEGDGRSFEAGVLPYVDVGYYEADDEPRDTDILCAFRVTPQPGVPWEEAAGAVADESSTATWTVVWTDQLTPYQYYRARCYDIEKVPGRDDQVIAYVAYGIDLSRRARSPT